MIVERNRVVTFHYTLSEEGGASMESSREGEPVAMLHGHGAMIPGVEDALAGREAGDRFTVTVPPERAYGTRREAQVQRVAKKYLANAKRLKPGDRAVVSTRKGPQRVTVLKVGHTVVDVDLNHPLAGRTLVFDIEIVAVREAQPEEIEHGHAHGPGGHGH